ncbi:MAG: substrate-binding domain-containing protein [Verrucomicrobiota bacterium]
MSELRFLSKIEQVAVHLREQIIAGKWEKEIPGRQELSLDLGVSNKTVESALQQLETDGVLIPQGAGRRRKIANIQKSSPVGLRIKFLTYEHADRTTGHHMDLQRRLQAAGHTFDYAEKSLHDLGMDVKRVTEFVENIDADAWIVTGGSVEILDWFARQSKPVIAQFGRFSGLPLAAVGVRKIPAMTAAVKKLISLGHRRIVMLAREERRKPTPAIYEQSFLNELESHGIQTGIYNLPDWEDNMKDFHRCIDSLFGATPPTAVFICETPQFIAAQNHLSQRGCISPRDVSLICDDPDSCFSWCTPAISHIYWDSRPVVSRILQWADHVAKGKVDIKQVYSEAEFIEGGTIGPVPG